MKLNEDDSVSEADRDTLGPLPPPSGSSPWGNQLPYSGSYIPPNAGFMPLPFNYVNDNNSSCKNFIREGSVHSGSGNMLYLNISHLQVYNLLTSFAYFQVLHYNMCYSAKLGKQ